MSSSVSLFSFYRFLTHHALYPILLSTLLAGILVIGRVYLSNTLTFIFLMWNLFLAWIPYLSSILTAYLHKRYPNQWWVLIGPGVVWLAFFPNAPYIITDFFHLTTRPPVPLWYDLGLLTTFAWSGLFLAIFSLQIMQTVIKNLFGEVISWLFVMGVTVLSGVGIYLGRFLRWNSWDLLFHPQEIIMTIIQGITQPHHHLGAVGFSGLMAAVLFICYLTLTFKPVSIEH